MTVQITIIGMGQIGTSIGLALAEHKEQVLRVGHDKDIGTANQAKKIGAVDRVDINIPHAVEEAGVVILALPIDQVKRMLEVVGPSMRQDAVLIDTSPIKQTVLNWVQELLPAGRHYIGLAPVINPAYLEEHAEGVEAAHGDLFKKGLFAIVSGPGVPSDAIKLATDLCHLLGAEHMFIDPLELDSLMATVHTIPQLLGAALLDITVDQPGWLEARKLTGRYFARVTGTSGQFSLPESLASEVLENRQQVMRLIDRVTGSLDELRREIDEQDAQSLVKRFKEAQRRRDYWLQQRMRGDWAAEATALPAEMPTVKDIFSRMIGFGRKPKTKTDKDK